MDETLKKQRQCSIIDLLQLRVDNNEVDAMVALGLYHVYGIGVDKSKRKAAELFERAYCNIMRKRDRFNDTQNDKWRIKRIAQKTVRRIILDSDDFPMLKEKILESEKQVSADDISAEDILNGALTL